MCTMTPVELVWRSYGAFGAADVALLLAGMAADIEWNSQYPARVPLGVWRDHDGMLNFLGTIGETLDVHQFVISDFVAQDDHVVVPGYEEATAKRTGRSYRNEWVHVWTLREGQVVGIRTYNDTAAVAAAFS